MTSALTEPAAHDARDAYRRGCPCRDVLDLLANKWSALALGAMVEGPQRFGALRRRLDGVSQKVLTDTLRRLERTGVVARTVQERPLAVTYGVTPLGREAARILAELRVWTEANMDRIARAQEEYDARA